MINEQSQQQIHEQQLQQKLLSYLWFHHHHHQEIQQMEHQLQQQQVDPLQIEMHILLMMEEQHLALQVLLDGLEQQLQFFEEETQDEELQQVLQGLQQQLEPGNRNHTFLHTVQKHNGLKNYICDVSDRVQVYGRNQRHVRCTNRYKRLLRPIVIVSPATR